MISPTLIRILATIATIILSLLFATKWEIAVITLALIIYNILLFVSDYFLDKEKKVKRW